MKTWQHILLSGVVVLGLSAASMTALTAPPWGEGDAGFGRGHGRGDPMERLERMEQRRAEHMAQLQSRLELQSGQQAAWQAFVDAQDDMRQIMRESFMNRRAQGRPDSAQGFFEDKVQSMEQRLEGMRKLAAAAGDLYAVLTPKQRATMDGFFANPPGFAKRGLGPGTN